MKKSKKTEVSRTSEGMNYRIIRITLAAAEKFIEQQS